MKKLLALLIFAALPCAAQVYNPSGSTLPIDNGIITPSTMTATEPFAVGTNLTTVSNTNTAALATPAAPVVTTVGTPGSTTWTYVIEALNNQGHSLPGASGETTTGNASLTVSNYNAIQVPAVPGSTSCDIYLLEHNGVPGSEGRVANVPCGTTYNDKGSVQIETNSDPALVANSLGAWSAFVKGGPQNGYVEDRHPSLQQWYVDNGAHVFGQNYQSSAFYGASLVGILEQRNSTETALGSTSAHAGVLGVYNSNLSVSYDVTPFGIGVFGIGMAGHDVPYNNATTQTLAGVAGRFEIYTVNSFQPMAWAASLYGAGGHFDGSMDTTKIAEAESLRLGDVQADANGATPTFYQVRSLGISPAAFDGALEATLKSGAGAPVSGCSLTTIIGGGWAGSFHSGTTGTCTVTITPGTVANNGFSCWSNDLTTPADRIPQTAYTTTSATISGTTVSGDVITWGCVAF